MISATTAKKQSQKKVCSNNKLVESIIENGIQLGCLNGKSKTAFCVGQGAREDKNSDINESHFKKLKKLGYKIEFREVIDAKPFTEVIVSW